MLNFNTNRDYFFGEGLRWWLSKPGQEIRMINDGRNILLKVFTLIGLIAVK